MGRALFNRLADHRDSIAAAERGGTLRVADFQARYHTVDDIWIPLGESLLIARFKPIWNVALDGFGNHDPGSGRYQGLRPLWDHIHPGREWATRCAARPETGEDITARIADYHGASARGLNGTFRPRSRRFSEPSQLPETDLPSEAQQSRFSIFDRPSR